MTKEINMSHNYLRYKLYVWIQLKLNKYYRIIASKGFFFSYEKSNIPVSVLSMKNRQIRAKLLTLEKNFMIDQYDWPNDRW